MAQCALGVFNGNIQELWLPNPKEEVLSGVHWGRFDVLFTPAFWTVQAWLNRTGQNRDTHRLGATFAEEVAACLLGGYGISAEIGLAAFQRLRGLGLLSKEDLLEQEIFEVLNAPLPIKDGNARYRFARQKSRYLFKALSKLKTEHPPLNDALTLRNWLLEIPGVGFKTSSWIVRNWLGSDRVAIIDIHVFRAGVLAGFFELSWQKQNKYLEMEQKYLNFAKCIGVKASKLDAIIWHNMRTLNRTAINMLTNLS